ncbi:MAG: hypothetical protein ACREBJ_11310, partial [Nitrosotalea sp.]
MTFKNDKIKTTIIATILSVIVLSSSASYGLVFAQTDAASTSLQSGSAANDAVKSDFTPNALAVRDTIDKATNNHPDWIGIMDWNKTYAKILYLGPADKSPYKLDHSKWPHAPFNNSTK